MKLVIKNIKYTVEEINGNEFISTRWDADDCYEFDRNVKKFETYSGALAHMYRSALVDQVDVLAEEV